MKKIQDETKRFIFLENTGRRWEYSKNVLGLLSVLSIIFLTYIVVGLINKPILTDLDMSNGYIEQISYPVSDLVYADDRSYPFESITVTGEEEKPKVFTFYQADHFPDKEHDLSLSENIFHTDVLIPNWLTIDKDGDITSKPDAKIDALAKDNQVQVVPSVRLDDDTTAEDLHILLSDSQMQDQIIENLLDTVITKDYQGIHFNFDDVLWEDKELYNDFLSKSYHAFQDNNLLQTVFVRLGDDTYDTELLSEVADYMMVNLFNQHSDYGDPGPLAAFQWTKNMLKHYEGPVEKLVPMLANYAVKWNLDSEEPAAIYDFSSLMEMVNREELQITWDSQSLTPFVRFKDNGEEHVIWLLDGATFYNQLKIVQSNDVPSIGIWNIGSEDPTIWNLLAAEKADPFKLETIPNRVSTATAGDGDFMKVTQVEREGERRISLENHFIQKANYEKYPTPYLLEKYGVEDRRVAISFDDGPDPKYTPQVLDILDEYDVTAAFFVIGQNASKNPRLTKNMFERGHEIGSHTFTHRDITTLSDTELEFELHSTQRVIQGITGHSAIMFRPPYLAINELPGQLPTQNVLNRFLKIQDLGYTLVSASIDPRDWSGKTADEIFADTISRVENGRTILLHDSGGDRTPTLEALPKIIEWLIANDYTIVPVSELVGMDRAAVMPKVQMTERSILPWYLYASFFNAALIKTATVFLTVLIVTGLLRLSILVFFSFKQKKESRNRIFKDSAAPFVTVLIAAYNEEDVIRKTIQSIMKSSYSNFEIIIVDDGSKDQTAAIVQTEADRHSNIQLIKKENGGKASALNLGIQKSAAEFIVTLDADTIIAENTIALIIKHFCDSSVGAVSGNVKIGNRKNILTWWQHIEYVTGYNLEKRAFDALDSITVVPGAIGAWRKSALEDVNLFEEDTLAEDTDVTMKLLRKGYKVRSEVNAIAYTEAPEDVKSFIKQRYRWTFGILQCLWKHHNALFNRKNKKLGFIALPNMIFQYVLLASAPIVDYIFILALLSSNMFVVYFYLVFLVADSLASVYAFKLEKENKKPLFSLFIQRLMYRQFFTFVVWKSFVNAIKGQLQGWNKLKRTGNVGSTETDTADPSENYTTTLRPH